MKSLAELDAKLSQVDTKLEKRTPISSLPFVINQSGSYYVTANLTGTASSHGINVSAANVTIDLMGHTLTGVAGSTAGIFASADANNLTIRNGSLVGWGAAGVFSNGQRCRAQGITATDNGTFGINLASAGVAVDCIAANNGGGGIRLQGDGIIYRCAARFNTGIGLQAGFGALVAQSTARSNTGNGIEVGETATVQGCTSHSNTGHNIRTLSGALVARCTAQYAAGTSDGIQVGADSVVLENDARENGGSGIRATGKRSRIESNHCNRNNVGIDVPTSGTSGGDNLVIKNSASDNTFNFNIATGNRVGLLVAPAVNGGTITGSTGGTSIPEPWANFAY